MAGLAALAGKKGGGGVSLMQAANIKKFANKAIDAANEKQVDEKAWQKNVADLHQVMKVARNLYLTLEGNNEALLRIAVEIVTCIRNRRVIFWDDAWYGDDTKRDKFKELVQEKLKVVVEFMGGNIKGSSGGGMEKLQQQADMLKAKLKECEAARDNALKQQKLAEMVAREAEQRASDLEAQVQEMAKGGGGRRGSGEDGSRIADLEGQLQKSQERCEELQRQMQALMKAGSDNSAMAELQAELERMRSQQQQQAGSTTVTVESPKSAKVEAAPDPGNNPLAVKLAAERKKHAEELERLRAELEEALKGNPDMAKAQRELAAARSRVSELEAQLEEALAAAGNAPVKVQAESVKAKSSSNGALERELQEKAAELDKINAKLAKRDAQLAEAKEEIEKLQEERQKMLRTIHQLRQQLGKLKELAEKRGYGSLVQELLEDSGLATTLDDEDFNCFSRLYEDALRRMERHKRLESQMSLSKKESAPVLATTHMLVMEKTQPLQQTQPLQPRANHQWHAQQSFTRTGRETSPSPHAPSTPSALGQRRFPPSLSATAFGTDHSAALGMGQRLSSAPGQLHHLLSPPSAAPTPGAGRSSAPARSSLEQTWPPQRASGAFGGSLLTPAGRLDIVEGSGLLMPAGRLDALALDGSQLQQPFADRPTSSPGHIHASAPRFTTTSMDGGLLSMGYWPEPLDDISANAARNSSRSPTPLRSSRSPAQASRPGSQPFEPPLLEVIGDNGVLGELGTTSHQPSAMKGKKLHGGRNPSFRRSLPGLRR